VFFISSRTKVTGKQSQLAWEWCWEERKIKLWNLLLRTNPCLASSLTLSQPTLVSKSSFLLQRNWGSERVKATDRWYGRISIQICLIEELTVFIIIPWHFCVLFCFVWLKGTAEDEMAGWHHWLDGRESGWTLGVGDGQGGLGAAIHGVAKSRTRLSDWTDLCLFCSNTFTWSLFTKVTHTCSLFFSSFWPHLCFGCAACGILVPWPGLETWSQHWQYWVLTPRPPGNSPCWLSFKMHKYIF